MNQEIKELLFHLENASRIAFALRGQVKGIDNKLYQRLDDAFNEICELNDINEIGDLINVNENL